MLKLHRYVPGLIGCAALFAIVLVQYLLVVRAVPVFAYPLDDTYIHMAMARTLAFSHVWGIGPQAFGSASSSIGWTVLLAGFDFVFGDHVLIPLLLNLVFGGALLLLIDVALEDCSRGVPFWSRMLVQVVAVALIPLPCLVFMGMEHTAHAFVSVLVVALAIGILSERQEAPERFWLLFAVLVLGSLRYEALFLIVPVAVLLAVRGRWMTALGVALAGAFAPVVFGLYSHHEVGLWLPFSVMMKRYLTTTISPNPLVAFFAHTHRSARMIAPLGALLWLAGMGKGRFWTRSQLGLLLFTVVAFEHLSTAPVGWMFRYEAYLYALMVFAFALAITDAEYRGRLLDPSRRVLACASLGLAVLLLIPLSRVFGSRLHGGILLPVLASEDRYAEHYQIAQFVHQHYDQATIMADDIGMLSYYTHAQVLDVIGLGSGARPLALHAGKPFAAPQVLAWGKQMGAVIAPLELGDGSPALTPPEWIKAETWQIPRNVVYGDLQIDFFATSLTELPRLCESLREYSIGYGVVRVAQPACGLPH